MNKVLINLSILTVLISQLIIPIGISSATSNEVEVRLSCEDKIIAGEEITVNVNLDENNYLVDTFIGSLEYDRDIFEEVKGEDISLDNGWILDTYSSKSQIFVLRRDNQKNINGTIMKIKLRVRKDLLNEITNTKIEIMDLELAGNGVLFNSNTEAQILIVNTELENEAKVKLYCDKDIVAGGEINLSINLENFKNSVDLICGSFEYDKDVFEKVTSIDFSSDNDWILDNYNEDSQIFIISNENANNKDEKIMNIKLKVRNDLPENIKNSVIELVDIEVAGNGINVSCNTNTQINIKKAENMGETKKEALEEINIVTEKYNVDEKYISNISTKTNMDQFINDLETNADDVVILKEDGSTLKRDEMIGTGMTIKLIRNNDQSKYVEYKAVVTGDVSGDGKITATDLSVLKQTVMETTKLQDEFFKAADIDESGVISATDLSEVNRTILGSID